MMASETLSDDSAMHPQCLLQKGCSTEDTALEFPPSSLPRPPHFFSKGMPPTGF